MTPLCSWDKGRSHERKMTVEDITSALKFLGGPLGTEIKIFVS